MKINPQAVVIDSLLSVTLLFCLNCSQQNNEHSWPSQNLKDPAAYFAMHHYPQLKVDAARGGGQSLQSLGLILGYTSNEQSEQSEQKNTQQFYDCAQKNRRELFLQNPRDLDAWAKSLRRLCPINP